MSTAAELIASVRDLRTKVETELQDHSNAIKQLERDTGEIVGRVERKLKIAQQSIGGPDGSYRGCFADEHQARAFGLYMLSVVGHRQRAAEMLKTEYSHVFERAMDTIGDGSLVPHEFANRILRLTEQYGVFEQYAYKLPMSSESTSFVKQNTDPTVYLVRQGNAPTESEVDTTLINLTAEEWGVLLYHSTALEEDSAVALAELLAVSCARAFAKKMDSCGFNGDATDTYFGITGLRQRLFNLYTATGGAGLVLADGNAYSEVTLPNLESVAGALPQYAVAGARWFMSRKVYWDVAARLILNANGALSAEIEGKREMMLLGIPVSIVQVMPTTAANSQVPILLGDLSLAATVGQRNLFTVQRSEHYRFPNRQITTLASRRVAVNVHDVGSSTEAGPVVGLVLAAS